MYILLVSYIYEVERGAYVIVPISHTLHTESIQGLTGFSTTYFSHHTNKSICRLPIIINLFTFVFYHHYVA